MNEVEKNGIGKSKVGFVVAVALVVTLAISTLWLGIRANSLHMEVDSLEKENESYEVENLSLQLELGNLTDAHIALTRQLDSLAKNNTDLQSEIDSLKEENENLQNQMDDLTGDIDDLEAEIGDLQGEIDWLRQIADEDNFQFYYASLAKQRYGVDDLEEYLDRWEWTEGSYVEGVFDCSEMSAYIEWRLENEGYHTYIICGESPWGDGYHAWLLVETSEGKYMPVEATQYDLVKWSSPYFDNYFTYEHIFETIQDALDYNYSEFDWWN